MSSAPALSSIFGAISVVLWVFVYCPQAVKVHQSKNVDGVSPLWLLLWFIGDSCNLIGCLMLHGLLLQIVLASYYVVMDLVLLVQWVSYHVPPHNPSASGHGSASISAAQSGTTLLMNNAGTGLMPSNLSVATASPSSSVVSSSPGPTSSFPLRFSSWRLGFAILSGLLFLFCLNQLKWVNIGEFLGWASAACYLISRLPQLWQNYVHKRTGELALMLFICAIFGNGTFALSLLCFSTETNYLIRQFPWIAGSLGTLMLDLVLVYQIRTYGPIGPSGGGSYMMGDRYVRSTFADLETHFSVHE